jgi:hypothetical protein
MASWPLSASKKARAMVSLFSSVKASNVARIA